MVLKKDFTRKKRKGGKLDYRWEGPFVITASLWKGLFKLKDLNGDKVSCGLNVHLEEFSFLNMHGHYVVMCTLFIFTQIFLIQVVQRVNGFHLKRYFQSDGQNAVSESGRNTDV